MCSQIVCRRRAGRCTRRCTTPGASCASRSRKRDTRSTQSPPQEVDMSTEDHRRKLLARLLGPSGPEVKCEECFELLDEYVELELAGEDADRRLPGLREHLDGCPACHEDHESLLALAGPGGEAA